MKTTTLMLFLAAAIYAGAADTDLIRIPSKTGTKAAKYSNAVKELKQSPEWIALQSDYDSMTNKLALYDADYVAATNAIAATTGTTKTALNKLLNIAEDNHKALMDMKTCIKDLKKLDKTLVDIAAP